VRTVQSSDDVEKLRVPLTTAVHFKYLAYVAAAVVQLKGSVEELSKFPKGVIAKNGFKVSNLYMRDSDSLHA